MPNNLDILSKIKMLKVYDLSALTEGAYTTTNVPGLDFNQTVSFSFNPDVQLELIRTQPITAT